MVTGAQRRQAQTAGADVEIGRLRLECLALVDADCVLPEDGWTLLATLDAALLEMAVGDRSEIVAQTAPGPRNEHPGGAARAALERFISEAQALVEAGALEERAGRPLLEAARALLAALGGPIPRD